MTKQRIVEAESSHPFFALYIQQLGIVAAMYLTSLGDRAVRHSEIVNFCLAQARTKYGRWTPNGEISRKHLVMSANVMEDFGLYLSPRESVSGSMERCVWANEAAYLSYTTRRMQAKTEAKANLAVRELNKSVFIPLKDFIDGKAY